jgi:FKBP-type peptidyl-prolyl cis-trans isomerase 2
MPDDKGSDWLNLRSFIILCVAMAVVIAGTAIGYALLSEMHIGSAENSYRVNTGDQVEVDYIGMFEDGKVFDTSILEVAKNNILYPKSLSFEEKTAYTPLSFNVGAGEMIAGFDAGVIGMATNETKILTIAPKDGYGYANEDLIHTKSLTQSYPVYEWTTNTTNFENIYYVPAEIGTTVRHVTYGWNATVSFIDEVSDLVLLKNEPAPHEIVYISKDWPSEVISIDTSENGGMGEIVVKHLLTEDDEGSIISTDGNGQQFIVVGVNENANTYTIDYNKDVVGKTLIFKVTVVSIVPTSQNP